MRAAITAMAAPGPPTVRAIPPRARPRTALNEGVHGDRDDGAVLGADSAQPGRQQAADLGNSQHSPYGTHVPPSPTDGGSARATRGSQARTLRPAAATGKVADEHR